MRVFTQALPGGVQIPTAETGSVLEMSSKLPLQLAGLSRGEELGF